MARRRQRLKRLTEIPGTQDFGVGRLEKRTPTHPTSRLAKSVTAGMCARIFALYHFLDTLSSEESWATS